MGKLTAAMKDLEHSAKDFCGNSNPFQKPDYRNKIAKQIETAVEAAKKLKHESAHKKAA